ncbi:Alanyl-tRNA editing protein AlaX-M [uncultured archaeon]|nr:Alanyl-tRNA editing protein AlaX-M [uncultured archaeon]
MTETLYLTDSYLKECDATVTEATDKNVVLDKTVFYPRGGGQPSDTGRIIAAGIEYAVLSVSKKEGKTIHELDKEGPKAGDAVHCVLNWERRYKLMRSHTAAHVLGATMYNELGVLITGNQIEEDKIRFDFNLESFDRDLLEKCVQKTNDILKQDIELKVYSLPREEAMKIPGIVKLAAALPPSISVLRIVEIPGVDIQADGGTHVRNMKETGQIELLKLENKGKDNRRIYFKLKE